MPNWKAIADAIGTGLYGDEIQDYKAKKQGMAESAERLLLAKNEDARAGQRAGMEAEAFGNEKSNWDLKRKEIETRVRSGEITNEQGQNELNTFKATGGEKGVAHRLDEDRLLKQRDAGRQDDDLALRKQSEGRLGAESGVRRKGQELENLLLEGTLPARIDAANDPLVKDSQLLNSLQQSFASAMRAGDVETAKALKADYDTLRENLLKKKAVKETQRYGIDNLNKRK